MMQAYGAYQVQGRNIGPWSKEILGREIGISEFMANPWMQDRIAIGKFREYLAKNNGNVAEAAANWNGGPGATAAMLPGYTQGFMGHWLKQPGVTKFEITVAAPPGHQTTVTQGANAGVSGVVFTLN
jgi:hypothetical protein